MPTTLLERNIERAAKDAYGRPGGVGEQTNSLLIASIAVSLKRIADTLATIENQLSRIAGP